MGVHILCSAQAMLSHNKPIINLSVDNKGTVIIRDIDGDYWTYKNSYFTLSSWNDKDMTMSEDDNAQHILYKNNKIYTVTDYHLNEIVSLDQEIRSVHSEGEILHAFANDKYYRIEKNSDSECNIDLLYYSENMDVYSQSNDDPIVISKDGIINICEKSDTILPTNFTINSSTSIDENSYLLASDNDLWIYSNGSLKKYYVPGVALPKKIKNIRNTGGMLWLLTQEAVLYNYDIDKQVLSQVATDVIDYATDQWQTIYLNKGKHIELNNKYVNAILPEFNIQEFKNAYKLLDPKVAHSFKSKENDIYIRLESQYTPNPIWVKYQYKLGKNDEWINHNSPELYLTDLNPDNYNLQFRATVDGQYYTSHKSIVFTIKPALSNSVWPYIFGGLLLMTLSSLLSLIKGRNEQKKLKTEKASIAKELSLLKSEQKLGQAQLNPHFLFNAFNSIAGMIAMNDNKLARRSLNQFAQLMRMALDNSGEESISVDEEIEFLEKYLSLERALRACNFDYKIETNIIDGTVPPMLIQPIVENAIIHGVAPLNNRRGIILITFDEDQKYIIVSVKDNGVGMTADKINKEYESKATSITESRLRLIDRWDSLEDYIQYNNLQDNSESAGTIVKLWIAKKRI